MTRKPLSLHFYLALSHLLPLVAPPVLRRRLARGKEDKTRWREKLGDIRPSRPDGKVIWINAVGLGEVLSLRGLITHLLTDAPDTHVLVTSTTKDSAHVFAQNAPPRVIHQMLPVDAPRYRRAFLDHWKPDLAVWAEQDLWPGFICDLARRGVPQILLASRMNDASFRKWHRVRRSVAYLLGQMALVTAQNKETQAHLQALSNVAVDVTGSLKPAAPPLQLDADELTHLQTALKDRWIWMVSSSYPEDERLALQAHDMLQRSRPNALLILVPRQIKRPVHGSHAAPRRSAGQIPVASDTLWIADSIGEMGLFLKLSNAALIGGTFNDIEGHNPWEAVTLGTPVLHGPRTKNFSTDFQELDKAGGAIVVQTADDLSNALQDVDLKSLSTNAHAVRETYVSGLQDLSKRLIAIAGQTHE